MTGGPPEAWTEDDVLDGRRPSHARSRPNGAFVPLIDGESVDETLRGVGRDAARVSGGADAAASARG